MIELVEAVAELARARELLKSLLTPMEGTWTEEGRERDAQRVRDFLGLCQTVGCDNPRRPELEADGYCSECLDDGDECPSS